MIYYYILIMIYYDILLYINVMCFLTRSTNIFFQPNQNPLAFEPYTADVLACSDGAQALGLHLVFLISESDVICILVVGYPIIACCVSDLWFF